MSDPGRSVVRQTALYDRFLTHCVDSGGMSAEARARVWQAMKSSALPFDVVVTELGIMSDIALEQCFSAFLDVGPADLDATDETDEMMADFDPAFARSAAVLPIAIADGKVRMAMANPLDIETISLCAFFFAHDVVALPCTRKKLSDRLDRSRKANGTVPGDVQAQMLSSPENDLSRLRDLALETPVVNAVSRMVQTALERQATDIHLEPSAEGVRVRLRLDGVLHAYESFPLELYAGIVSRVKILAGMNIAERRLPQDGRMRLAIRGTEVDFRVSSIPSIHGETIVLRLLRQGVKHLSLQALGYAEDAAERLLTAAHSPNGMVVVTGPTGSGKTTTLYALVDAINKPGIKVFTIEDPVEYRMAGVTQLQVDSAIDLSFSRALRSVLRQDPDVILVGEIRDRETAQIAVQAALTGHLVLTTLHTNDAAGALSRLKDMGVDPFLLSSTIKVVVGQRLLRKRCQQHAEVNCPNCSGTGFSGRTVTYEVLQMSQALKQAIDAGRSENQLRSLAIDEGLRPLEAHARELARTGITTAEEVARVVSDEVFS